jgi:hypothetical protein
MTERTERLLGKLGYAIVPAESWEQWLQDGPPGVERPDLRLVDDRCMSQVPPALEAPEPIILLTDRHGVQERDSRMIGAVMRPAGLHELFRLLQNVLEEVPRSTPRVATNLRARVSLGEQNSLASILSLSENGCLLRTAEQLGLGTRLRVTFSLPNFGEVATEADVGYQMFPDLGLVFDKTPSSAREAIRAFVDRTMAAA